MTDPGRLGGTRWSAAAAKIVAEVDRTVLTGASIDTVFSKVCARLRRDTEAAVVWIVRRTTEGRLTVEAIDAGLRSAAAVTSVLSSIGDGHPILRALESREPDATCGADTPLYRAPVDDEIMVVVPIRFPNRVHAALSLHVAPGAATDRHLLETVAVVANHLGLAWSHAEEQGWLRLASQVLVGTETAVLIGDRSGTIQWVNQAFTHMTGWPEDGIRGRSTDVLRADATSDDGYGVMWETVTSGETWRGVLVNRRRDGSTVRAHATVAPVRDEAGRIVRFVALQEDLTELEEARARAEAARREAFDRLQADRAVLVQTVSHELRTPLTVIRGAGRTLRRPELSDEQRALLFDSLERATADLDEKLQLVLATTETISRPDRIPMERVDLAELVVQVGERIGRHRAEERLRWRGPDRFRIVTVRSAIETVLRSLIDNALRFSPEEAEVEVHAIRDGGEVLLRVRDHGPGFDPAFLASATEPFTQGDQSLTRGRGGLGIGLAVASNLSRQLGGSVEVGNVEDGAGAVATVLLPQRREGDLPPEERGVVGGGGDEVPEQEDSTSG